jgi:transcriptional regulator with XRE-family HTH domain
MSRDNRNWGLGPEARLRLGRNVTVRRLRMEVSRAELGARGAISTRRLTQVEEGRSAATLDVWVRIAGTLDESLDDLLAGLVWVPFASQAEGEGSYVLRRPRNP